MAKTYADNDGKNRPLSSTRQGALRQRMLEATAAEQPDWGRIEDRLLWQVIQTVTKDDGGVMFGYSRDGGAYAVKVYAGGEPIKHYSHTDAEVTAFLVSILEAYNG